MRDSVDSSAASPRAARTGRGAVVRLLDRVADVDRRSLVLLRLSAGALVLVEVVRQGAAFWAPPVLDADPVVAAPPTAALPASSAVVALLVLASLGGVLLLIGYRTRAAAGLAWLMLTGVAAWRDAAPDPVDAVLRLLLLWCVLLPVGARFSIDHATRWSDAPESRGDAVAGAGFLVQLVLLNLLGPYLLGFGSAGAEQPLTLTAHTLLVIAWLPSVVTHAIDWMVLASLAVVVLPIGGEAFRGGLRLVVVMAMVGLHVFLGVSLTTHLLPIVLGAMWLAVLPRSVWDAVFGLLRTPERAGLVLWHASPQPPFRYRLLHTFLLLPQTAIRCTREDIELDLFRRQRNSWIVTDAAGYRHLRFRAVAEVMRASPLAWPLAPLLRFGPIETVGDWAFDVWQRWRPTLARFAPAPPSGDDAPRTGAARSAPLIPLAVAALLLAQVWLLLPPAPEPMIATLHELVRAAFLG